MEEEDRDYFENDEIVEAVGRFRRMVKNKSFGYFDVYEIEGIIDYFLDEDKIKMAQKAAEEGLKIHPYSVPLQIKKAQILLINGHTDEALEMITLAEQIEESNSDIYLIKGSALIMKGEINEAIDAFENAILHNIDEKDDLLYNIGVTLGQAGEIHKAIYFLEQAYENNPQNELVLYELGYYHDKNHDFETSLKFYDKYLDIDPFNSSVWYNMGITYNRTGKYEEAVNAYDFSIALHDGFEQAYFNKANALFNCNRLDEAIQCYQDYIENEKDNDDAYCYLGECYLNLEKYDEALKYYRKSIRLNKNNAMAWYGSGLIYWMQGQLSESLVSIKKALKLDDENPDFWSIYGKINMELGLYDSAESAFQKSTNLDPDNPDTWVSYAEMEHNRGSLLNAITILKNAYKNIHNDVSIHYRLAAYLLENNDELSATNYFEKALEIDSNSYRELLDYYPEALQNESIKKLIKEHQSTKL